METKEEIVGLIEKTKIKDKQALFDSLLPSIKLIPTQCELGAEAIGTSRMGGFPDLPSHFEWPSWVPPEEKRKVAKEILAPGPRLLDFIAQINLEDIARFQIAESLPHTGMLYFFYDIEIGTWGFDPKDIGSARVVFFEGPVSHLRRVTPEYRFDFEIKVASLTFAQDWTIKDTLRGGTDEEFEEYLSLLEVVHGDSPQHRLLGQPQTIQNEMEEECQLVTNGIYLGSGDGRRSAEADFLRPGVADWCLLMQVDTDEERLDCMWGDGGKIYFWIRRQDLREKNFGKSWLVLQCY